MKKSFFLIALFTLSLLTISSSFAQKKADRKDFKKRMPGIEKLNLTDAQQEKFNQIQYAQQEKAIDTRAKLEKNRLEIKKLLDSKNFNPNDLVGLTKNASNLRSDLMESRVNSWISVYNILDETQKAEWTNHFARMMDEFGGHGFDRMKRMKDGGRFMNQPPRPDTDQKPMMDKNQ